MNKPLDAITQVYVGNSIIKKMIFYNDGVKPNEAIVNHHCNTIANTRLLKYTDTNMIYIVGSYTISLDVDNHHILINATCVPLHMRLTEEQLTRIFIIGDEDVRLPNKIARRIKSDQEAN